MSHTLARGAYGDSIALLGGSVRGPLLSKESSAST